MNVERACTECKQKFSTADNRRKCTRCRRNTEPCPNCGGYKYRSSLACKNCAARTGEANGNWKGGTTRHAEGYIYTRVEGKYKLEHIHVMEQSLGRTLYPGETVHHKNGVKDDNRLENLELWVTSQPSGQRPEDLVDWARQILERYSKSS